LHGAQVLLASSLMEFGLLETFPTGIVPEAAPRA
jgi:hypothetical protein